MYGMSPQTDTQETKAGRQSNEKKSAMKDRGKRKKGAKGEDKELLSVKDSVSDGNGVMVFFPLK